MCSWAGTAASIQKEFCDEAIAHPGGLWRDGMIPNYLGESMKTNLKVIYRQ
jgi:hypothetical protein